ncbi:hypothetical protein LXL04_027940 [Taraxacum kok-saghyz]
MAPPNPTNKATKCIECPVVHLIYNRNSTSTQNFLGFCFDWPIMSNLDMSLDDMIKMNKKSRGSENPISQVALTGISSKMTSNLLATNSNMDAFELVLGFRHPWFFPIWVFHVNPCVSVIYCFIRISLSD